MPNTDDQSWDINSPADADPRRDGARECRLVRASIADRINKEHVDLADAGVGGEHVQGSAVSFFQDAEPTTKADGATALDSADDGRLWVDTTDGNNILKVYDGTEAAWEIVKATPSGGDIPASYFNFDGVALDTFSTPVTLTFLARKVTVHKDNGSDEGWTGTFLLPATPLETSAYCRIFQDNSSSDKFELKRSDASGFTLELKYTNNNKANFNGTWSAHAEGSV